MRVVYSLIFEAVAPDDFDLNEPGVMARFEKEFAKERRKVTRDLGKNNFKVLSYNADIVHDEEGAGKE